MRPAAETAALLAAEVLPERPLRQWVLSLPHALRFLLATDPDALTRVLGVVYRTISRYPINKTGVTRATGERRAKEKTLAPYPVQAWLTTQLKTAALTANRADLISLRSGQGAPLLRHHHARELVQFLVDDTERVMSARIA